jgi:predicted RNase H-like nuclease (RuvC/YqgF family)
MAALTSFSASADDAARISRLESEIQLLRTQINEQNRRIQRLEDELSRRSGAAVAAPEPRKRANEMRTDQPTATARLPWHSPEAWDRVARGMTTAEVMAILGEPTVVESLEPFKTLFYRGAVPGGGSAGGHVNLRDGRVVAVSKPAF